MNTIAEMERMLNEIDNILNWTPWMKILDDINMKVIF
jgi:hypothetical protein